MALERDESIMEINCGEITLITLESMSLNVAMLLEVTANPSTTESVYVLYSASLL